MGGIFNQREMFNKCIYITRVKGIPALSELQPKRELHHTRPFTSDERKLLSRVGTIYLIIGTTCIVIFLILGIIFALVFPPELKILMPSIFIPVGIFIGLFFLWIGMRANREVRSGEIEIITGRIENKSGFFSNRSKYIMLNSRYYNVTTDLWRSVTKGDTVTIEWAPSSKQIIRIYKANETAGEQR